MKNEGNEICQAILKQNGTIVPRHSNLALNPEDLEIKNETEARKRLEFDAAIQIKHGDSFSLPNVAKCHKTESNASEQHLLDDESFDPFVGVQEVQLPVIPESDCVDNKGQPILQHSLTDTLINNELLQPHGEELLIEKVLRRLVDEQGKVIGSPDENPILNTIMYDVEFLDGNIKKYLANFIAENVLVNCDSEGYYS